MSDYDFFEQDHRRRLAARIKALEILADTSRREGHLLAARSAELRLAELRAQLQGAPA